MLISDNKAAGAEGKKNPFSRSVTNKFASAWLPMREADSKNIINQKVSVNKSCLWPCCKRKEQLRNEITAITKNKWIILRWEHTFSCSAVIHASKLNKNINEASAKHTLDIQILGCADILLRAPTKRCRMQYIIHVFLGPLRKMHGSIY